MLLNNVTLELSSKAFRDESEETMHRVAQTMFRQWGELIAQADVLSVMLWIADGSEILEYTGDLDQKFEWACWCGVANHGPQDPKATERQKINTHPFPKKYIADAAPRPYSWLKKMIEVLREEAFRMTGKALRIGATFDNGPEFSKSDFKYHRHVEIAQGHTLYPHSFVVCNSTLHADDRHYAGFPDGIPEGTTLGAFLGRQFAAYKRDLGYDYIWLSNGMGFGQETWGITGALFDKREFHPEKADEAARTMLDFWHDFIEACPGVDIETRGSNFSAGTEIATDGAPLKELYGNHLISVPVNSPWAALNFNTGLEIAAWMSHVAELSNGKFPFRFYTHDPWFCNSPWLDRYSREPWDIYLPLSISRMDDTGRVSGPDSVSLLTVDDTFGRMPDRVPNEVTPKLLDALESGPDAPGPLLWVYPFDEYTEMVRGSGERHPETVFNEDMFLGETIQAGFPLNTVISTGNFKKLMQSNPEKIADLIWVVPVSAADIVLPYAGKQTQILFYGALAGASEKLRSLLKIETAAPLEGEVEVVSAIECDQFRNGKLASIANIWKQFDGGGLTETFAAGDTGVLAYVKQGTENRALAVYRKLENGAKIGFIRSAMPCINEIWKGHGFDHASPTDAYPTESLMRQLLAKFGWSFENRAFSASSMLLRVNISRHDNAYYYSALARDTSVELRTSSPFGAPLLTTSETLVENGRAVWHLPRATHAECRAFVKQESASVIHADVECASFPCYRDRRVYYGFVDAEVRFFPPENAQNFEAVRTSGAFPWHAGLLNLEPEKDVEWEETANGCCAVFHHVTGGLYFAW